LSNLNSAVCLFFYLQCLSLWKV